jgi:hypothetical protein
MLEDREDVSEKRRLIKAYLDVDDDDDNFFPFINIIRIINSRRMK